MKSFIADVKYQDKHPNTITLHCSDGRFATAINALLNAYDHSYYDIMTLPGGAALLDMSNASMIEVEASRGATSFLINGHSIEHAFLVAHEGCGFYKKKYPGQSAEFIQNRQVRDLQMGAIWIAKMFPKLNINMFMAAPNVNSGQVFFSLIEPGNAQMAHMSI
jgi:hypothetical protein